jgi:hypothetical protein
MDKTNETTPTQPELVEGMELVAYTGARLLASETYKVIRLTKTQAVLGCRNGQIRVRRQPSKHLAQGYCWYPVDAGSRWYYVLATPELQGLISLSKTRQDLDRIMQLVSHHSHKLDGSQLNGLLGTCWGYLLAAGVDLGELDKF